MHKMARLLILALTALTLLTVVSCVDSPRETGNSNTTSPAASNENSPPASGSTPAGSEAIDKGSIKVASTPAGAEVLLIIEDVGGASPPEPRGTTPMTITDLAPGTYTVHLEKPGYKFFQKSVQVKPGEMATVVARLTK